MTLRPSDRAWCAIGVFVVVYNLAAKEGETLSEGADRYMLSHRWITRGVAFALVSHVCNMMSPRFDIIHLAFSAARSWEKRLLAHS